MNRYVILLLCCIALNACGANGGLTQTAQTERYSVQLSLDQAMAGKRTATLTVNDSGGQPVEAEVVVAPVMREMGMASPEVTAQPLGAGRYRAADIEFSMAGEWELDVRISAAGSDDTTSFKLIVSP
jgi:hypothetical protein